jgi:hypothetical protein
MASARPSSERPPAAQKFQMRGLPKLALFERRL